MTIYPDFRAGRGRDKSKENAGSSTSQSRDTSIFFESATCVLCNKSTHASNACPEIVDVDRDVPLPSVENDPAVKREPSLPDYQDERGSTTEPAARSADQFLNNLATEIVGGGCNYCKSINHSWDDCKARKIKDNLNRLVVSRRGTSSTGHEGLQQPATSNVATNQMPTLGRYQVEPPDPPNNIVQSPRPQSHTAAGIQTDSRVHGDSIRNTFTAPPNCNVIPQPSRITPGTKTGSANQSAKSVSPSQLPSGLTYKDPTQSLHQHYFHMTFAHCAICLCATPCSHVVAEDGTLLRVHEAGMSIHEHDHYTCSVAMSGGLSQASERQFWCDICPLFDGWVPYCGSCRQVGHIEDRDGDIVMLDGTRDLAFPLRAILHCSCGLKKQPTWGRSSEKEKEVRIVS